MSGYWVTIKPPRNDKEILAQYWLHLSATNSVPLIYISRIFWVALPGWIALLNSHHTELLYLRVPFPSIRSVSRFSVVPATWARDLSASPGDPSAPTPSCPRSRTNPPRFVSEIQPFRAVQQSHSKHSGLRKNSTRFDYLLCVNFEG